MHHNLSEIVVKKKDLAIKQLDAAINAHFCGEDVIAITLAGAAEEIFGAILKRSGKRNSVEQIASLPQMLQISSDPKKRIAYLNSVRNNLKHASEEAEDDFVICSLDPFIMIVRALGNASLLQIDDSLAMKKFREYYKTRSI